MQPSASSHPSDPSDQSNPAELIEAAPTRRKLLGTMAAAGALLESLAATHVSAINTINVTTMIQRQSFW